MVAEVHASGSSGADAEDRLEQLGAAGAHEPVQAEDLALAHVERDVLQVGIELRGEVLDRQNRIAGLVVDRREAVVERAAHHGGDELVHVGVGGVLGHDHVAVAQHRHVVADLEDLVHLVRDVDERDALALELAHHLEELVDLLRHERGGGLVEHDDLGVVRDGLGDLAHLALRDAHVLHRLREVHRHAEAAEQVSGLLAHAALVDHTQAVGGIAAEEQVVDHAPVEALVELLVHHGHAVLQRVLGPEEVHLLAFEENRPLVLLVGAEQALHHGGLARAVLAHEAHDGALPHVEVNVVEDAVAAERLAHAPYRQDDVVLGVCHALTLPTFSDCTSLARLGLAPYPART